MRRPLPTTLVLAARSVELAQAGRTLVPRRPPRALDAGGARGLDLPSATPRPNREAQEPARSTANACAAGCTERGLRVDPDGGAYPRAGAVPAWRSAPPDCARW